MIANLVPNRWNDEGLRAADRIGARMASYARNRLEYRDGPDGHGWFWADSDGTWQKDESNARAFRTLHAVLGISEWLAEETNDDELREDVAYARSNKGAWKSILAARELLRDGDAVPEDADAETLESIADLI